MPQISVIVPVYNAQLYLDECVRSILSQTFSDLELILVDDGSPDQCPAMCDAFARDDPRVRVLHQRNQGQAAARNAALEVARGPWVCFVDSDDAIHPQTLELLYNAAVRSGAAISMCRMLQSQELPADFDRPRPDAWELVPMDEQTLCAMLDRDEYPGWVACAKLIRRSVVDVHHFCPGRVYEDNEAVCHWLHAAGQLALLQEELYFYRTNPASTTQSVYSLKKLDYIWALEKMIGFFYAIGYEQMCLRLKERYARTAADLHVWTLVELERPDAAEDIRASVRRFLLRKEARLTSAQYGILLDALYPRLAGMYWPLAAGVDTLRQEGLGGLVRKLKNRTRGGEWP